MGNPRYENGFELTLHPDLLTVPLSWKKPRMVFVNSMSDLFHEDVPLEFIQETFKTMKQAYWHTFQVLTKRSSRLLQLADELEWSPNIWMGVSIENRSVKGRIKELAHVPATVRFMSIEPILEDVGYLELHGIKWVIVGGESGPRARPVKSEWVRSIHHQCLQANVAFFFKQWGGVNKKKNGRLLDGRTWDEMPFVATEQTLFNKDNTIKDTRHLFEIKTVNQESG